MQTTTTTNPCPSDQAAPLVPGRSCLAAIALTIGIPAEAVAAYVAHQASFRAAPHRLVATVIALQVAP